MKKLLLIATAIATLTTTNVNAQLFKKLKEKVVGGGQSATKKEQNNAGTNTEVVKSTLTDFQRSKLKEIIFLDKTELDVEWNGENESDCVKTVELGKPLSFKAYFDNGGWDSNKDGYLDIRFTCNGETFTGYDLTKYAYDLVEKAPGQNTFGHMVKFETAFPINAPVMQKTKEWITLTLQAPRGLYWPQITRPEDAFRLFLATKLKNKLLYGSTLKMKVELYKTDIPSYEKGKTPKVGEVYATGEINLKVTPSLKELNSAHYRLFSEGLVDKALSAATAKQVEAKFPTTVKKVHKVFFLDDDFVINRNGNGNIVSRTINGWVIFETQDGVYFNTKTALTYQYNGGGYSNTPLEMQSGLEDATFPIISGHAIGR